MATAPKPAAAPKTNPPRVPPQITAVSAAVPMPDRNASRGSKTSYPFESLTTVGMSFGVKNKTAKQLASIISNQNKKPGPTKRDANGAIVFVTKTMDMGNGATQQVPTTEPELMPGKKYFAVDCDPKKDPDGANVRVFRNQ